ncbi:hypothetical protein HO173_004212 [Letharia columbiana]|uniref:Uncharacterized protein n=1 Tax=Letharia columbiana TaxID=112416 RepID=A0A8H6G0E1_9LECA|nr:uncharacterized protein HO173_004212 [Letharia columbiana]KAF6238011.1 hypothetical protein HO173_004212 [Letharia columbiana]
MDARSSQQNWKRRRSNQKRKERDKREKQPVELGAKRMERREKLSIEKSRSRSATKRDKLK